MLSELFMNRKKDKTLNEFIATINLTDIVNIPKNSKAIVTSPLVGSWYINIEKGKDTYSWK